MIAERFHDTQGMYAVDRLHPGPDSNGMPFPDRRDPSAVRTYILEKYRRFDLLNSAEPVMQFLELYNKVGVGGNFPNYYDITFRIGGVSYTITQDELRAYCMGSVDAAAFDTLARERKALYQIKASWRNNLNDSVALRVNRAGKARLANKYYEGTVVWPRVRMSESQSYRYSRLEHFLPQKVRNKRDAVNVAASLKRKDYLWLWQHSQSVLERRVPEVYEKFANSLDGRTIDWGGHELVRYVAKEESAVMATLRDSKEDKLQVAFCESWDKFLAGRYTRMKPGRFLAKYASKNMLTEAQLKTITEGYIGRRTPPKVYFIDNKTPDGWEDVYESAHGFSSCMMYNHPSDRYIDKHLYGENHPVRAYCHCGNHLKLAYLANREWDPDSRTDGFEVYARAIVYDGPNGKGAVRTYGDERLGPALRELGYPERRSWLNDAVLTKRVHPANSGGVIAPYLDWGEYQDGGDHLIVSDSGVDSSSAGWISQRDLDRGGDEDDAYCCICDGSFHEDDVQWVDSADGSVCSGCIDEHFVEAYNRRGLRVLTHQDNATYCEDNDRYYVSNDIGDMDHVVYDHRGDLRHRDSVVWCESEQEYYDVNDCVEMPDGDWAPKENAVQLHNGDWVLKEDAVETDEGWYLDNDIVTVIIRTTRHYMTPEQFEEQAHKYSVEESDGVLRVVPFTHSLPSLPVYLSTHKGGPGLYGYEPKVTLDSITNVCVGDNLDSDQLTENLIEHAEFAEAA